MKTYCLTLSQVFPSNHPKAGKPTNFEGAFNAGQVFNRGSECLYHHPKLHTIRANYELWRKRFEKIKTGEACLSVRQWVGKPYGKGSTQKEIARLTCEDGIGLQKLSFFRDRNGMVSLKFFIVEGRDVCGDQLAWNDGLSVEDWRNWFRDYDFSKPMAIIQFTNFRY